MKHALWASYQWLTEFLLELGFAISSSETSIFNKSNGIEKLILLVYADDIVITSNSSIAIDRLMKSLGAEFA